MPSPWQSNETSYHDNLGSRIFHGLNSWYKHSSTTDTQEKRYTPPKKIGFAFALQTLAFNCQALFLFPMQNVHPPDGLSVADLAQIDLGRLQILMPQNDLVYDLQGDSIPAGIRGRMSAQVVRRYFDIHLLP